MSIINELEIRSDVIRRTAEKMMTAARTAPKAKGIDNLEISIVQGYTITLLSEKLKKLVEEGKGPDYFVRDAENILKSEVIVLIGTKIKPFGIKYCGFCGFSNCEEKSKHPDIPCALNTGDLGIAIGSAVSIAMDERVDNRIMHSVGIAAVDLKLLGEETKIIYGIPLYIGSKNVFFDRN
ncbi:MAG: ferredoxin domain-containing protein [Sedimentibacter sp.]